MLTGEAQCGAKNLPKTAWLLRPRGVAPSPGAPRFSAPIAYAVTVNWQLALATHRIAVTLLDMTLAV